jgi:hypothetical protein
MKIRLLFAILTILSLASADTLTLRNGKTVQGSYLGGNSRQIRMVVGDSIQTFDVGEVASIQFEAPKPAEQGQLSTPDEPAPVYRVNPVIKPRPDAAAAPVTAAASAPAPAAAAAVSQIPAGTNITIRMIDDVDSKVANVGQTFRASVDEPVIVDGRVVVPRGADVVTKLVELQEPGKIAGGGQLTLDLASITIDGRPVPVNSQGVTTAGESRKGESAKVIGGTAALGAIIGAIAGGGKGAAIGAIAGGGAGTAVQVMTQGPRVRVPSESRLTFTLQQPVNL